jgi:hypothetical protein
VDATSLFGLTDDFGTPQRGVYYHVEVVEPKPRRRGVVGQFEYISRASRETAQPSSFREGFAP